MKLVWWFVAAIVEEGGVAVAEERGSEEEEKFEVEFCGYEDAVRKLTFQLDREMVEKAIELVEANYPWKHDIGISLVNSRVDEVSGISPD